MSETLVESLRFFASPRSVLPEHDMMLAAAARIAELEEALKAEANADRAQANYDRLCSGLSEADEATIEDAGVFALELRQTAKELRVRALHTEGE